MERDTIRKIRSAIDAGRLPKQFRAGDINKLLKINWAGAFLPKHRCGNPGGETELFVRIAPGLYKLKA